MCNWILFASTAEDYLVLVVARKVVDFILWLHDLGEQFVHDRIVSRIYIII